MITIILENEQNQILKKISASDNREYLLKSLSTETYPILSELSDSDNEMVTSDQMPQLIQELNNLKLTVKPEQAQHIDEVIQLAKVSESNKNYFLIFTPFGSFWKK